MPVVPLILVGEDDAADQFLLQRAVQKAGLNVELEFANDGYAVLQHLQQQPERVPNVLLLDLMMPHMDGFQVLQWLREHGPARPQYVIVLTSCARGEDLCRCCELGVDHYLVKPADPMELVATLKRLEPYWAESRPAKPPALPPRPIWASAA